MGYSIIQELGDGHIIGTLGKELGHRDIVLKEPCDGGVQVLVHSLVQELSDCNVIGAARSVQELGDCDIIGLRGEELGD